MDIGSSSPECFALLDDRSILADTQQSVSSRLYTDHVQTLQCFDAQHLPELIEQMQQALQRGLYAVTLFAYELGAAWQGIAPRSRTVVTTEPLAEIMLFTDCRRLTDVQVDLWLQQRTAADPYVAAGIANLRPSLTIEQFNAAIAKIHAYIEAGETYQVNYTYRLRFDIYGSPYALYRQLRQRQSVPYGALIALSDGRLVLSLSPELFVRHTHGLLTVRPMKGTAAASGDVEQDHMAAQVLAADAKNRAENLMIVDLLRNDLGRIALLGSVKVSCLFDVQRFNSVLQMTSTVQAQIRADVSLIEVLKALYPCGSITGAPKHRTMQIIDELEPDLRRLYTGAIGWFDAPTGTARIGAFCLSVPIRTLLLSRSEHGIHHGEMGIGAGIVHDSVAAEEYAECALKAQFLTGLRGDFSLFETMYATREQGCRHLSLHLQRLQMSAAYFGFPYDESKLCASLQAYCTELPENHAYRLRLTLLPSGAWNVQTTLLDPLEVPVKVLLATAPIHKEDVFLRHKTTVRHNYDQAWQWAEQHGAFDTLFFNNAGVLTEGGRSNVFVKLNGHWYTPPLSAGLLPGVMRSVVLADPVWDACERNLFLADVQAAEQVMVCNALRGILLAEVIWDEPSFA